MDDITAVSWDFNSDHATNVPVAKIEYYSFRLGRSGTLVYNGPAAYTPGTWQTEDGFTGMWWSTETGFGGGDLRTLAQWQLELTDVASNYFVVGMGSTGGAVPATTAYADLVRLAGTRGATPFDDTWDFEGVDPVDPLPPEPQADVLMNKTLDTTGTYTVGDTIQYTLEVANVGPDAATNVLVDDIPTNLTISSVASTNSNCTALPCTIPTLASGAFEVITVMATINAVGTFDNAAGALAETGDPDLTNNFDDTGNGGIAIAVPVPVADIDMIKTLDTTGPYTVGDTIQYTLKVVNGGPDAATNILVSDTPTNLTISSVASPNCTAFPCTIPTIAAFAVEDIIVMATINAVGAFDNEASAFAVEDDPDSANNIDNTGNGGTAVAAPIYVVGGSVSGLIGSVTLQNNGGDDLPLSVDGSFNFSIELLDGSAYAVTVLLQPAAKTLGQTCTVTNGSGTISSADVSSVVVTCVDNTAPPVTPPTPGQSKSIPTLSEWALILMSGLLGLAVFIRQRKLL